LVFGFGAGTTTTLFCVASGVGVLRCDLALILFENVYNFVMSNFIFKNIFFLQSDKKKYGRYARVGSV
jgi:hypothetical protein